MRGLFSLLGRSVITAMAGIHLSHASTVIYQTGFEKSEGYDPAFTLSGQRGWVSEGSGGNGLLDAFVDLGQQAYIGFTGPTAADNSTSLFRPIQYQPVPTAASIIKFSVIMEIVPSTNGHDDDFRWSVYNNAASPDRLFAIDFEGRNENTGAIALILDNGQAIDTGYVFGYDGTYTLDVWFDFARNLWSAALNDFVIANSEPITTQNADLSLGDVDAVWILHDLQHSGDNYMLFDNYRVTAEDVTSIPATVQALGMSEDDFFQLRVMGEAGLHYSVEVTIDFQDWFSLGTFLAPPGGTFTFEDTTSKGFPRGFYRVREVD